MPKKVIKEEAKTEILKNINDYMRLLNETMPEEEDDNYAEFSVYVKILSELTDELYTPDENDEYPKITEEKLNSLISAYQQVILHAGTVLRGTGKKEIDVARREIAEAIKELASEDVAMLTSLDEGKLTTLPESIEQGRMITLDMGKQKLTSSSGQMSSRIPIEYVDANGDTIKGFFTKESIYDPKKEMKKFTDRMRQLHPDFAEIYDALDEREPSTEDLQYIVPENYFGNDGMKIENKNDYAMQFLQRIGFTEEQAFQIKSRKGFKECYFTMQTEQVELSKLISCLGESDQWLKIAPMSNIDLRNAAMSSVANLLGMPDIIAKAEPMELIINGEKVKGTFMANAKGSEFYHLPPDSPIRTYPQEVYDNPAVFPQLANLQILDYVCGNIDRHEGNFFMEFDTTDPEHPKLSKITGIDNDMSFGTKVHPADASRIGNKYVNLNSLTCIPRKTFDIIANMDETMLRTALRNYNFSEEELSACWGRLNQIKTKVMEDLTFFNEHPEETFQKDRIKVVEDHEWSKYNLSSFCKKQKGANKYGVPIYETMSNQFEVFNDVEQNVFRKNNIERVIKEPAPLAPKTNPPAVGVVVPKEYNQNDNLAKATARYVKAQNSLAKDVLKTVTDAELFARGSEEFKLMGDKLKEIAKETITDDKLNSKRKNEIAQKYEELALLAYNYLEKKDVQKQAGTNFGKNTVKRLAAAKRVLEFASAFNPERSDFVFDNKKGQYKPDEATNAYEDARIKRAYEEIKYAYPKMKIDFNKAKELLDEHGIELGNAHGLAVIEKEARDIVKNIKLPTSGLSARVQCYLFYDDQNRKQYIEKIQKPGVEGYEFRKNEARKIVDKILEINEDMFKEIQTPEDCVELVREHGSEFGLLFDLESTYNLLQDFNYPLSDMQKRQLESRYAEFRPIINSIIISAQRAADPIRYLLDPSVISAKDQEMMYKEGKLKGTIANHMMRLHTAFEGSTSKTKAINIAKQLGSMNAFGTFARGRILLNANGLPIAEKELCNTIMNGDVVVIFKENETTGLVINGTDENGKLKFTEGDLYDALKLEAQKKLAELNATNVGKIGDSQQIKDFKTSLENLCQNFTSENVQDAVSKARAYDQAKKGQKINERRDARLKCARGFEYIFSNPGIEDIFTAKQDKKFSREQASKRVKDVLDKKVNDAEKRLLDANTNLKIAKFEDEVLKIKDPETKKLGLMAVNAKSKLNSITAAKFGDKLKAAIAGYMAVTVAFQEKLALGKDARTPEEIQKLPQIKELADSMTIEKCKRFINEDADKIICNELQIREKAKVKEEVKEIQNDELNKSAFF